MIISSSEQGTKILLICGAKLAFTNIWDFFPWLMPLGHLILFAATIWRMADSVFCLGYICPTSALSESKVTTSRLFPAQSAEQWRGLLPI